MYCFLDRHVRYGCKLPWSNTAALTENMDAKAAKTPASIDLQNHTSQPNDFVWSEGALLRAEKGNIVPRLIHTRYHIEF